MNISVFGTGEVGSAVASKLNSLGHDVVFGSRHPGGDRDGIPVLSHVDAAAHGDWIVNALHGEDAMATLVPLDQAGRLLVDIGNWRSAIDSPIVETLGESLQRALPRTRVVKAMNFPSAQLMGHPEKLDGNHSIFLAADDAAARAEVKNLLESFGWLDIIDLGDLTACRAMESLAPMWIRLNEKLGHVWFNLHVVRNDS
ncbi:NAD(P)-binding domain-containing protein [Devosia oryziradicis]|uniref:NAD(P)-binding domain-containing protein n=1 Tax=Devosia oryziradicis TaxID=2801335 RepID=A0ABX7BVQ9_9HYPH|nr:NAD(P)-binding domain-containing protein [Devosia oryziradicis]QQR35159.1 NAD(P)-binding domain-containing protein [Devosia oryziradicis]